MEKLLRYIAYAGVALILVGVASCNIPFLTPGDGGGGTTGAPHTPSNPDAPANTDGAETILIPWGTFWMGSLVTDAHAGEDEFPRHQVTLDGFYIYTHEVTNNMYAECVAAGACLPIAVMESGPTTHAADPAFAEYPVVGVDWNMADDYCAWAGGRLPTEAEWEMASRGTESLTYPWGEEDPDCDRVNMLGCSIPPDTVEVGSYLLGNSPEGVWDLSGNVWEWVHDWYGKDYYSFSPSFYPLGPYIYENVHNPMKVVRGGGLFSEPAKMRSAERAGTNPYRAYDDVGFRCVTPGGLALPDGYVPPLDRHEMVPPDPLDGGGEHVEEPDGMEWVRLGFSEASCPTPDGLIYVIIEIDSSLDVEYDVTLEGVPFDCYYNEVLRLLHCRGPLPDNNDELIRYHFEIRITPGFGIAHAYPERPLDCDSFVPERFSIDMDCPDDGLFTISFFYEPPITWDTTRISDMDIPCVRVSATETRCTAPDFRVGDHYEFYLHGTGEDGAEFEWMPWVPVREDCPVDFLGVDPAPFCLEGHRTVQIMYRPEVMGIGSVSVGGVPLDCIGMAPDVMVCGDLPGAPGDLVELEICTDTGACFTETVTVPDCSGPVDFLSFLIEPYCYPPEAPAPAASIHYWPFDEHLVSATVSIVSLSCGDWGGGWYVCSGVPGTPGDMVSVTFCLEDGHCENSSITVPECGAPPPGEGGWRMTAIGCHDAERIYFQIDTGLAWLVPGADFTYSATDGETTYACTVNPAMPGRIYCSGFRPLVPGPLEFCLQRAGDAVPTCQTYPDYNMWVGGIPSCAPPEEPEEPVHVPSCADYTDAYTCGAEHKGECVWIYADPQHCEDAP